MPDTTPTLNSSQPFPCTVDDVARSGALVMRLWSQKGLSAAGLLGLSRSGIYDAVQEGTVPSIRIGRELRVPTVPLLMLLGVDPNTILDLGATAS